MARTSKPRTTRPVGTEPGDPDLPQDALSASELPGPPDMPPAPDLPVDDVPVDSVVEPEPMAPQPDVPTVEQSVRADPGPTPAPPARPARALPLILGGVVAGAIGFGAGWAVQSRAPVTAAPDLSAVESRLTALEQAEGSDLPQRVAALESAVAALPPPDATLADRVTALENRPDSGGAIPAAPVDTAPLSDAIAALQARVQTLETASVPDITAMQTDLSALDDRVNTLAADLQATADQIVGMESAATADSTAALARAAVTRIQAAIDSGSAFDTVLPDLDAAGIAVPPDLAAVAQGVPTLSTLQAGFPDAARAALTTAREEGLADDGGAGVMGFLRSQLDIRSVAPREGTDPDAILSRAQAALDAGRLNDALAEIATLPEVLRAAMGDWLSLADSRRAALAAAQTLTQTLPAN